MVETPWQMEKAFPLTGGHNSYVEPEGLERSQSPYIHNFRISNGNLVADYGYGNLADVVDGTPRKIYQYTKSDSVTETCLITNTRFYIWNNSQWQYVQDSTSGTLVDGQQAAGETVIEVDDETIFSADDVIGIMLDNGQQHQTTVVSTDAGPPKTVTITDAIPTGRNAPDDTAIIKAAVLTGIGSDVVSVCSWAPDDWVVFTNENDNIKRYDGTDCRDVPNLPSGGNCKARIVRVIENYLVLFGTQEGGTVYPRRVRWCDTGDPTNWATGNAGYEDQHDTDDFIIAAERLGPYIAIYNRNSIFLMQYIGSEDQLFLIDTKVTGEGATSVDSVLVDYNRHYVVGQSSLYIYSGDYETQQFGEPVYNDIYNRSFTPKYGDLINWENKTNIFVGNIPSLNEFWFCFPIGSELYPRKIFKYNKIYKCWYTRLLRDPISSLETIREVEGVRWLDANTAWNSGNWEMGWDDLALEAGDERIIFGGTESNQCFEYSREYVRDLTYVNFCYFETIHFTFPVARTRVDFVALRYKIDEIGYLFVILTIDDTVIGMIGSNSAAHSSFTTDKFEYQGVGEVISYQFLAYQSSGIEIPWYAVKLRKESDW